MARSWNLLVVNFSVASFPFSLQWCLYGHVTNCCCQVKVPSASAFLEPYLWANPAGFEKILWAQEVADILSSHGRPYNPSCKHKIHPNYGLFFRKISSFGMQHLHKKHQLKKSSQSPICWGLSTGPECLNCTVLCPCRCTKLCVHHMCTISCHLHQLLIALISLQHIRKVLISTLSPHKKDLCVVIREKDSRWNNFQDLGETKNF